MSEDKGELAKNSSSEEQPISNIPPDESTDLARIEERLLNANSSQEVILWTQVRGEIIRQNEIVKDGEQRRFLKKVQVARRIGLSVGALTIGTVLVTSGLTAPGLFVLGAGLYELAPEFIKEVFLDRGKSKKNVSK
jgi:hypothetical protein